MNRTMARKTPPPAAAPPDGGNPWPARLKALRERLGLSQAKAAARLRINTRSWASWEYGQIVPTPPMQLLIELLEKGAI